MVSLEFPNIQCGKSSFLGFLSWSMSFQCSIQPKIFLKISTNKDWLVKVGKFFNYLDDACIRINDNKFFQMAFAEGFEE